MDKQEAQRTEMKTLVKNADTGPNSSGRRRQWLKRLVAVAEDKGEHRRVGRLSIRHTTASTTRSTVLGCVRGTNDVCPVENSSGRFIGQVGPSARRPCAKLKPGWFENRDLKNGSSLLLLEGLEAIWDILIFRVPHQKTKTKKGPEKVSRGQVLLGLVAKFIRPSVRARRRD